MADLSDIKAAARKAAYAVRKDARDQAQAETSSLLRFVQNASGQVVSGYWPIRTEIDPRPALHALAASGRDIVLPVVEGAGKPLSFRYWRPGSAMIAGAFGAAIPADPAGADPQVLIVPLLAFDARGFRLGYGGGFYDRTLQRLRARGEVLAVGFAYAAQQLDQVPTEPTDQPLDAIATENGVVTISPLAKRLVGA